ncbi:Nucleolysin TIAR, partial [Trichinella pseudospiralis]
LKLYLPITFSSLYIVNSSQCCFCQSLGNCDIFICIAMSYLGNYPSGYSGAYGDATISEEFLLSLFSHIGGVSKCKIIHETASDPYAFVEFVDHASAVQALTAMNKRLLLGKEMRVNWATSPGTQAKVDTSMIRDLQTLKSKGYGFVSYVSHDDAERAIEQMNGQWLGRRTIRTNWATRKPGLPDDDLRRIFARFGSILEVRVFKQQGYAFVRFDNKESAAHAILNITGTEINGSSVRCSWGKEGGLAASNNTAPNYGYGYNFNSFSTPPVASHSTPANPNFWNQYYTSYMPPHGQPGPNPAPTVYPQQWQTNYWPPQGQQQ